MKTNKIFFISIILFMLCWVIYLFNPFLLSISIGVLLAVSTSGINTKFMKITNNKTTVSAILTTLVFCIVFFVPFVYAIIQIAKHSANLDMTYISKILNYIKNFNIALPYPLNNFEPGIKDFISNFDIKSAIKEAAGYISVVGKSGAKFAIDMGLIIVFYFFANLYGNQFAKHFKKLMPIEKKEIEYVFSEVGNTMSVVFYSTISNAMIQGFLFSIIAGIYGYDYVLMWILFAFASLIPVVGGGLIYFPIGIYELSNGNISTAVIIVLYSIIVISIVADNFIKPLVIRFINSKLVKNPANINEISIFFAMLAGIATFGFWGIMLGPAILTIFVALIKLCETLK